ncbi:competence protein CoiA [Streptomyces kronopolitis]|uniref:competence protein CoiA family protein n=1 Tax=Streptomyces kronopolitis TaxID=1612435 RepID=UPI0036BD12D6
MAFRAVHGQWGAVLAHLPDLGCGRAWDEVWKVHPPAPLRCDECAHPMYAKTSRTGLRFFAHAPGAPTCALALESVAHHLFKLELATAARGAGAHAELEVRGPDGRWRADVLATDPAGAWKTALEAQLAPITDTDITARTATMLADGVTSIWFSDRPRPPWLGSVPSVRLKRPEDEQHLAVVEGLVKFSGGGWSAVSASLTEFLTWVFARRIAVHTPRTPLQYPQRALATVWTAPRYATAETAHLADEERLRLLREARQAEVEEAQEKKRDKIRAQNAGSRAKALQEASAAEHAARARRAGRMRGIAIRHRAGVDQALEELAAEHDVIASVGWSTGDPRYAGGVPLVDEQGVPAAVLDPDPGRVVGEAFLLLAGLLLIFPSKTDLRRFNNAANIKKRARPLDGYRTAVVETAPAASTGGRRPSGRGPCDCAVPQLVAKIHNAEYPAEPSEQMGPAAALFRAE